MNELKFRLRSLVTPSVDSYLSTINAVVNSMDNAAAVLHGRSYRLGRKADKLMAEHHAAFDEARRAERIADRFRELVS